MFIIQQLTSEASQFLPLILEDGSEVDMTIYFRPLQYGWFIDQIVYGDFILNGVRITNSPNILHQFRNLIPFGLACISKDDREPTQQEDFQSGASHLWVLTQSDVAQYAEFLQGD